MRAHLNKAIIRKVSGTPADGSVQVYEPGTTTPIAQTMYVGDTGATARANPFAFANGVVEFYLDTPQRVKLVITPTGGSAQTFDNVDVVPPAAALTFGASGDIGASAVGDVAVAGSTGKVADAGHRHPRESFGAVTAQTTFGLSSSNGSSINEARSDHTHGTPATPSAAAVGAVALAGDTMTGKLFINVDNPITGTSGTTPALRVGTRGGLFSYGSGASNSALYLTDGLYYNGSAFKFMGASTARVGALEVSGADGLWFGVTAAGGAADATASLTAIFAVTAAGNLTVPGTGTFTSGVYDGGNRVYSAANPPPASGAMINQTIRSSAASTNADVNVTIAAVVMAKTQLRFSGSSSGSASTTSSPQSTGAVHLSSTTNVVVHPISITQGATVYFELTEWT